MTDRENLIALIQAAVGGCATYWAGLIADHLLANGVTFATDNHVGGKWIPVTERLPSETRVIDGEAYIKNVAVRVRGVPFEAIAFYDEEYDCWFDDEFMPVAGEVTHWMPLPEPPKEGE